MFSSELSWQRGIFKTSIFDNSQLPSSSILEGWQSSTFQDLRDSHQSCTDGRELGHGGGGGLVPVAVKIRFNYRERERESKNSIVRVRTSRFLLLFLLPSCCTIARQRLAARRGEDTCSTRQGGFTIG